MLDAYHLTETRYKNEFTVKELQNLTAYSVHKVKRWLKYLENNGLVSIDRIGYRNARIYKLHNDGKEISKKIIKKYKKYYNIGYNEYLTKFRISN
ncbi:MAG: hypothetical protein KGD65_01660 [Candidatus Lokiarchaeota archaeon]|nr:hypothetical protein [Candidatus Lokiarchaeota archaeon]